ncbi:sensor histidine kinase [Actinomyces slackii]|uniref:histidine kinase n=1 Tax=Actinomyces slackii TaxID=52774 RepID=A0A3S4UMY4_9ACTO|nr:histidine kinase [Actinomyces slackii]VEG74287.1 Sensor histidine kinase desK [Actinomyces slackii]
MPSLQAIAVICQVIAELPLLKHLDRAPVVVGAFLCVPAVLALAWAIRHRARSPRVRAVCSVTAFVCVATSSMVGSGTTHVVPALLIASALVVIDLSLTAGLIADLVYVIGLVVFLMVLGHAPLEVLGVGVGFLALVASGTILGLVLARYDAVLADQRQALAERDAALVRAERQAAVEKELMLAQERARAAHELHDGLGHRLTQIGMSLEFASRVRRRDPEAAWQEIAVAERTSREAVGEMRTWVRALSPASPTVLAAHGTAQGAGATDTTGTSGTSGAAGLEAIAASFRGTGVHVEVTDEIGPGALAQEAELLIYRAVQEGLTNALRHSGARSITIGLAADPQEPADRSDHVTLTVTNPIPADRRDDIPTPAVGERGGPEAGFGLRGLSESAAQLGGGATAGRDGETFRLRLTLPTRTALRPQEAS